MMTVNLTFDQFMPINKNGKSLTDNQRKNKRFYASNIAGVSFYNTSANVGPFIGYMEYQPNNAYDPHAVAVYEHNGRLIGYLPKSEHRKYSSWIEKMNRVTVVGYIYHFYISSEDVIKIGGYVEAMKMYTDEDYDMFSEIIKKKYEENKSQYEYVEKDTARYYEHCHKNDTKQLVQTQDEHNVQEQTIIQDTQEYEEDKNIDTLKWIAIAAISISVIFVIFM